MKNLSLLLNLITQLVDAIKELIRQKQIKDLKDVKDESIDTGDQRKLEDALGGSSGPVDASKYGGVFIRDVKETKD